MPMNCEMNSLNSLSSKFSDLKVIAGGADSSIVLSGVDKSLSESSLPDKDGSAVAIKRLPLVGKGHCRVALREMRFLNRFHHENVVKTFKITDCNGTTIDDPTLENFKDFDSVYVVEELLDTDLQKIINKNGKLSLDTAKLFMYQLLRGLKYIHSANVMHRDIKPGNLFVNGNNLTLKIGDYGLARVFDERYNHKGYLTAIVSTRYYRAPEVIVDLGNYTYAIDMWSAGCVFGEMLLGKVLFAGDNDLDQLNVICSAFGLTAENIYTKESSFPQHLFDGLPPEAIDLLTKLLCIDSSKRVTAEQALRHSFFSELHDPLDEPTCEHPFYIEHEIDNLPVKILKRKILKNSCMTSFEKKSYHSSEENLFKDFDETFACHQNNFDTCTSSRKNRRHQLHSRHFNSHGEETESSNTNSSNESPTSSCHQHFEKVTVPMMIGSTCDLNKIGSYNDGFLPSLKDAMSHEVLIDEPFRDPGVCERKYHEAEEEVPVKSNIFSTETNESSYFSGLSPVIDMTEPVFPSHNNNNNHNSNNTNNNTKTPTNNFCSNNVNANHYFLEIPGRLCADNNKYNSSHSNNTDRNSNSGSRSKHHHHGSHHHHHANSHSTNKSIECLNNEILRTLNDRKNTRNCPIEALLSDKFAKQPSSRPMAHWGDSLKFWI